MSGIDILLVRQQKFNVLVSLLFRHGWNCTFNGGYEVWRKGTHSILIDDLGLFVFENNNRVAGLAWDSFDHIRKRLIVFPNKYRLRL